LKNLSVFPRFALRSRFAPAGFVVSYAQILAGEKAAAESKKFRRTEKMHPQQNYGGQTPAGYKPPGAEKKVMAGVLGIVLGAWGVHKFILGYTQEGLIQIGITIITCGIGGIIGLIEGIIYLTKSDEEFVRTYIQNKKGWF
jgi:TM2 domain-containing membrane protein YozV